MTPSVVGCGMVQATLSPPNTLVLRRASCCCLDRQPMRNLPDGSGRCDRMGPTVRWNRLAVLGPLSRKLATPVPRSSSTTGCCRNVGGGWLPCRRKGRPAGAGFGFSLVFSLAISVSVTDFPVSFDFSVCVSELRSALARRAFLLSLRRRCKKSLPSEVSLSMFTSSSSVLFLILFGVLERFIVVFVQFPTKLSSFTGRTPESLHKSPTDHMVPTLVMALPLLLSYTYFPYNLKVFVFVPIA